MGFQGLGFTVQGLGFKVYCFDFFVCGFALCGESHLFITSHHCMFSCVEKPRDGRHSASNRWMGLCHASLIAPPCNGRKKVLTVEAQKLETQ